MATVTKGYDLDYTWACCRRGLHGRGVPPCGRGGGEPPGTWVGPGAERPGFAGGHEVEREPYNLPFGERKGPNGRKLGRAPPNAGKAAEIYDGLLAAEPSVDDHRKRLTHAVSGGGVCWVPLPGAFSLRRAVVPATGAADTGRAQIVC
jgi:hypothetical protein